MFTTALEQASTHKLGKQILDELYIHTDYLERFQNIEPYASLISSAIAAMLQEDIKLYNVAKINITRNKLSFLQYLDFENDAFPILNRSCLYDKTKDKITKRIYATSLNPPILHRKELLVDIDHPLRQKWVEITKSAEELGFFSTENAIGFKLNWERVIANKGFVLIANQFQPLGNEIDQIDLDDFDLSTPVQRHLTALSRSSLSAPVQLMIGHGLITKEIEIFDYGCGKGDDLKGLNELGYKCKGWDPHFASENSIETADIVNLGFVVNVIEDPVERVEAIQKSFNLARIAIIISVMLHSKDRQGKPYRDGFISSRNTFQKYFSQDEFKDYLQNILEIEPIMIGPGIAIVFADKEAEQAFLMGRYRSSNVARRLLNSRFSPRSIRVDRALKIRSPRITKAEREIEKLQPVLNTLWTQALELGRFPESHEIENNYELLKIISLVRAKRLIWTNFDLRLLEESAKTRSSEIKLFLAERQFSKQSPYKELNLRLRTDIKTFFGDYKTANQEALKLLVDSANPDKIRDACEEAASEGLGWLDTNNHSLQLHSSLVERLPIILRAYVTCGLVLWNNIDEFHIIKIHIASGKLTLLQYANFENEAIPLLIKRIKINIPKLDYDVFEYDSINFSPPPLLFKSRYMHEDLSGYAEQLAFDEEFDSSQIFDDTDQNLTIIKIKERLSIDRKEISGLKLQDSNEIPQLDQRCGKYLSYRDLIHCGETQARLGISNIPLNPETYNSILKLCRKVLDPVIEYFGAIKLTYGFCSNTLGSEIKARVAPKLDQHASCEYNLRGKYICTRKGAAVDFIVEDESMLEVAQWLVMHCDFDRIYFYGNDKPIHVSYGPDLSNQIVLMMTSKKTGQLIPKVISKEFFLSKQINSEL